MAETANPWPITADGLSWASGWSPDGVSVLVNRWGQDVSDAGHHQLLSELWAIDVVDGAANLLSDNAVQPAVDATGKRVTFLSYVGGGDWEVRWLDRATGKERVLRRAPARTLPSWQGDQVHLGTRDSAATAGAISFDDEEVQAAVYSPESTRLVALTTDELLRPSLWIVDGETQHAVRLLQGESEIFSAPSWSPDGRTLAFSRAPLGTETLASSSVWFVDTQSGETRLALPGGIAGSTPLWSPDGQYLAFNRNGDVWLLDLARPITRVTAARSADAVPSPSTDAPAILQDASLAPLLQQTPPATIRVIHRADNYYRSAVPVGQIDVIPFETYVKRCVPVEMPALWNPEAVKTQAVAARTYAWYNVLVRSAEPYDVSDWTDFQVMGRDDQRHWASDQAVDATSGQYVAYQGDVIKAFYSAENSSPTTGIAGVPYIEAVDDPVSLGETRRGHGWGMSQWGAKRWADEHGWGYQQILTHYYTGVTVELPSGGGPVPIGALILPWSDFWITGNQAYVTANASDESSSISSVLFSVITDTSRLLYVDTQPGDGWGTVWDAAGVADTARMDIVLSATVVDGSGHSQTVAEVARIGIDRQPPVNASASIANPIVDQPVVTLFSLSATDPSPGSGLGGMAFGNENWRWEGEDLNHQFGERVVDGGALNGVAWRALAGVHGAGGWYGPYTYALPPGVTYRAYFRLKVGNASIPTEVAMLDVVDEGGARLLGVRRLRGTEFRQAGVYQEFAVDFVYPTVGSFGIEFRTWYRATTDLYLDRVLVVEYPVAPVGSVEWELSPGLGDKTVYVKFIDGAGNVSADTEITVSRVDEAPPGEWSGFSSACWAGGSVPVFSVRVRDATAGLDVSTAHYRYSVDGRSSWSDWLDASCTGSDGTTELQAIAAGLVPFVQPSATENWVEFSIADMGGQVGSVQFAVWGVCRYIPIVLR